MIKPKRKRGNIFFSYFVMFAMILLVTFAVLGTSLTFMVNKYSIEEKTNLLKENTQSIAQSVSSTLIVNNMNSSYSHEKEVSRDCPVLKANALFELSSLSTKQFACT